MDELAALIAQHGAGGQIRTAIPGVTIMAAAEPTLPLGSIAEPALALVVGGAKRTVVGDETFVYTPGEYLIVSLEIPVVSHVCLATAEEPFLAFGLTLRPATIAALLLEGPGIRDPGTPSGFGLSRASPALLDAVLRMLRLLDAPGDARALAPVYEREILWRLITGPCGAMVRQIGLADGRLTHLARAIGWLRSHYDEPLRVEDLADLAGMSPSAFHRHFRSATSMTPIQFQKHVRLHEARALLLIAPDDVAGAAFKVGYRSPSQFSREYRRMFGAPPSRDVARLRAAA